MPHIMACGHSNEYLQDIVTGDICTACDAIERAKPTLEDQLKIAREALELIVAMGRKVNAGEYLAIASKALAQMKEEK